VEAIMLEVAQSEVPVLLLAEQGDGKQATARRIHDLARRRGQMQISYKALLYKLKQMGCSEYRAS
jgi:DNA-binding NtrC family response regulator